MKVSTLKSLIQSFISWLGKHKLFWMMLFYEFLFVYFLAWAMMIYSMFLFQGSSFLEIFIVFIGSLIFFCICSGSFVALHLLRGTPQYWKIFILLSLPTAYHLFVKSIWILGISFMGAGMRGGMVSLDARTYEREYHDYHQGSYSEGMKKDYVDKKLTDAQLRHNLYLQSWEGRPTPCSLIKTPVKYWRLSLF